VSAGVPLAEVKALLGHSTVKMTERYAHLAPENVRAAVAKLDGSHTFVTPGKKLDRNELTLVR
jgi:integrase